jgi:hypothetical protein
MYLAKRTITAGRDKKGKRKFFVQGKSYNEVPESLVQFFEKKGEETKKEKKIPAK